MFRHRNPDLQECTLEKDGEKLNFAIVNGFKNIQNVVQKMKRKRYPYDYVEIMACPSGKDLSKKRQRYHCVRCDDL